MPHECRGNIGLEWAMIGLLAGLAAVLTSEVESLPRLPESYAPVEFEDPKQRGAPIEADRPRISKAYRGTWADSQANCYATSDRGVQVAIGLYAIGAQPVKRVWGYSDYPAMIVETIGEGGKSETAFLDLSVDGHHISIGSTGRDDLILEKCPQLPNPEAATGPGSWLAQAESACKAKDFDAFFEAFLESQPVQWKYRARKIRLVRPEGVEVIKGEDYGLMPFMSMGDGYLHYGTEPHNPVRSEISTSSRNTYRVDWSQAEFEENGEVKRQFGAHGWLLFNRRKHCWQLVEDRIEASEAR
jgi:hypothetical protein